MKIVGDFLFGDFEHARPGAVVLPHGAIAERHLIDPHAARVSTVLQDVPRMRRLVFERMLVGGRSLWRAVVFQQLKEIVLFSYADVIRAEPDARCGFVGCVLPLYIEFISVAVKVSGLYGAWLRCKRRARK